MYACYGAQKNPYTHGTTTCSVELTITSLDLTIVRTSHPTSLVVTHRGTRYEHGEAQDVISRTIGLGLEQFRAVALVTGSDVSILEMTPSQRLAFIESIAGHHAKDVQTTLAQLIKEKEEEHTKTERDTQILESQLDYRRTRLPLLIQPEKSRHRYTKKLDTIHQTLQKLNTAIQKWTRLYTLAEQAQEQSREYEVKRKELESLESEVQAKTDQVKDLEGRIAECGSIEDQYNTAKDWRDYTTLATALSNLKAPGVSEYILQGTLREDYSRQLSEWTRYDQSTEVHRKWTADRANVMSAWTSLITFAGPESSPDSGPGAGPVTSKRLDQIRTGLTMETNRLASVKMSIKGLKAKIRDMELSGQSLKCPKCSADLCYDQGQLMVHEKPNDHQLEITRTYLQEVTREKEELEHKLANKAVLLAHIKTVDDWIRGGHATEPTVRPKPKTPKDTLQMALQKDKIYSEKYQHELAGYNKQKKRIEDDMRELYEPGYETLGYTDDDFVRMKNTFRVLKDLKSQLKVVSGDLGALQARSESVSKELADMIKVSCTHTMSECHKKVQEYTEKKTKIIDLEREIQGHLESWSVYDRAKRDHDEYSALETKVSNQRKTLASQSDYLSGLKGIQSTVKEAEILTNQEIVDEFNDRVQDHLSQLCADDIQLSLEAYKHNPKTNEIVPSMTLVGYFNGTPIKDVNEDLSGGYKQFCTLAYRLAMGDVLGRKWLFMDESLDKLDSDNYITVLEYLKTVSRKSNCQIIVISHHLVDGLFDTIISPPDTHE